MKSQNTNVKVLIANAGTAATETTLSTLKATGAAGEIIAVEQDGTAIATGSEYFMVAVTNGDGTIEQSEIIPARGVVRASVQGYTAAAQKIDYIGSNGTTGSIEAINSNHYIVNCKVREFGSKSVENYENYIFEYESDASTSQAEIANGLVASAALNFKRLHLPKLRVERVIQNAGTALGTGVDTIVLTKGSKYFTATDIDDATTNAALAVGDYLRVGTGVTDPVYKITAIDTVGNVGTLDIEFQGANVSAVDTSFERIPAATAATANFGLKLTGLVMPAVPGKFDVHPVRWDLTLLNFGATTSVVDSTAATYGIGTPELVREMEWFAQGAFGDLYRTPEPHLFPFSLKGDLTLTYDVMTIDYYKEESERLTMTRSPRQLIVFANAAGSHANMNVLIADLTGNTVSSALNGLPANL